MTNLTEDEIKLLKLCIKFRIAAIEEDLEFGYGMCESSSFYNSCNAKIKELKELRDKL